LTADSIISYHSFTASKWKWSWNRAGKKKK